MLFTCRISRQTNSPVEYWNIQIFTCQIFARSSSTPPQLFPFSPPVCTWPSKIQKSLDDQQRMLWVVLILSPKPELTLQHNWAEMRHVKHLWWVSLIVSVIFEAWSLWLWHTSPPWLLCSDPSTDFSPPPALPPLSHQHFWPPATLRKLLAPQQKKVIFDQLARSRGKVLI